MIRECRIRPWSVLPSTCGICAVLAFVVLLFSSLPAADAVRANWGVRQVGPSLEKEGKHEEAAFFYRAALDFYAAALQFWIGSVYDGRVDEIYQQYVRSFDEKTWRSADHEERWDTMAGYLFFSNRDGAARNVDLAALTAEQRTRLEHRLRVYMEDLINPDSGFGGDFSFSRKAWILERMGLFWHAAFRRELAGRYAIQVCSRYYAAVAEEMEHVLGDPDRAELYRRQAAWWRERGLDELHLCNGDRALSRLKGGDTWQRLGRDEVIAVLERGLRDDDLDTRRAAVLILADMDQLAVLETAMMDEKAEIRKRATTIFGRKAYLPGLLLALEDSDDEVVSLARAVLETHPESVGPHVRTVRMLEEGLRNDDTQTFAVAGLSQLSKLDLATDDAAWLSWVNKTTGNLRPGVQFRYFSEPDQQRPVTAKILDTVDVGMKFQANFPKVWYDHWDKPEVFPADAKGPFRLEATAKLYVPRDGEYRFYIKTTIPNRARLSIQVPGQPEQEFISPRNDAKLQYVMQAGMPTHRIDFCEPIPLSEGWTDLRIVYTGDEVQNIRPGGYDHIVAISGVQKVGLQLFWSSNHRLMELVPAEHLFH